MSRHGLSRLVSWRLIARPAGLLLAVIAGASPATAEGTLLWQRSVGGSAAAFDQAAAVAVDSRGDVVAAGSSRNTGTDDDFTVVKFDRDGNLLWKRSISGTAGGNDAATAVAVDNQGNVLAAGRTENTGTGDDFTIVKLDRNGTLLWRRSLSGTAGGADAALSVAVDGAGSVIAAGTLVNTGSGADFVVAKFDRNGTLLWRFVRAGAADGADGALSVALDPQGHPVAAGFLARAGGADFAVAKLDRATGGFLWIVTLAGAAGLHDEARCVAVDKQGNIAAAGITRNSGSFPDFTVARYNANGTFLWQQTLNGAAFESDQAHAVAIDASGDVIAAGSLSNDGSAEDLTVMKLARDDGAPLWVAALDGAAGGSDAAFSVAVDPQGNVIAGGLLTETDSEGDFAVLKLNGADGAPLWRQVLAGGAGTRDLVRAVAIDGAGSVIAAGLTTEADAAEELTVIKFDR